MIYPSIDKLVEKVESKYTLVSLVSRRARGLRETELVGKKEDVESKKYVGIALNEVMHDELNYDRSATEE